MMVHDSPPLAATRRACSAWGSAELCRSQAAVYGGERTPDWQPRALETWRPGPPSWMLLAFQLLELGEVASLASFSFPSLKSQGRSRSLLFKMS